MTVGKDVVGSIAGQGQISEIPRGRFAPDAIGSIFPDVVKLLFFKRAGQRMDAHLMEFDMLRQKAEARTISGSDFPDEFVSVLRAQTSGLAKK